MPSCSTLSSLPMDILENICYRLNIKDFRNLLFTHSSFPKRLVSSRVLLIFINQSFLPEGGVLKDNRLPVVEIQSENQSLNAMVNFFVSSRGGKSLAAKDVFFTLNSQEETKPDSSSVNSPIQSRLKSYQSRFLHSNLAHELNKMNLSFIIGKTLLDQLFNPFFWLIDLKGPFSKHQKKVRKVRNLRTQRFGDDLYHQISIIETCPFCHSNVVLDLSQGDGKFLQPVLKIERDERFLPGVLEEDHRGTPNELYQLDFKEFTTREYTFKFVCSNDNIKSKDTTDSTKAQARSSASSTQKDLSTHDIATIKKKCQFQMVLRPKVQSFCEHLSEDVEENASFSDLVFCEAHLNYVCDLCIDQGICGLCRKETCLICLKNCSTCDGNICTNCLNKHQCQSCFSKAL
eukprot:Awhi_evm2s994